MKYFYIVSACWAFAFIYIYLNEARKNSYAIERLKMIGASNENIQSFKMQMSTKRILLIKIWASFFFGSLAGATILLFIFLYNALTK